MPKLPIAVQLYTVRDDAAKDYAGTIKKVAEIGYTGVELAGHGGLSVPDLRILLENNNLKIAGSHIGLPVLQTELSKVIDENLELGNPNVVVPWLDPSLRGSSESFRTIAQQLNSYGEKLTSAGLSLAYHNHDFEFDPLDSGEYGLQILMEHTDPRYVSFEVDTYWVLAAGHDPVDFITKNRSRISLLHIKDRDRADGSFAEIGTGTLPLGGLVSQAEVSGKVQWLIVEQDVCKRPPFEAIAISFANLAERGYA